MPTAFASVARVVLLRTVVEVARIHAGGRVAGMEHAVTRLPERERVDEAVYAFDSARAVGARADDQLAVAVGVLAAEPEPALVVRALLDLLPDALSQWSSRG